MNKGGAHPKKIKKTKPIYQFWCSDWFFCFFLVFFGFLVQVSWSYGMPIWKFKETKKKTKNQCQFTDFGVATGFFRFFLGEHPPPINVSRCFFYSPILNQICTKKLPDFIQHGAVADEQIHNMYHELLSFLLFLKRYSIPVTNFSSLSQIRSFIKIIMI